MLRPRARAQRRTCPRHGARLLGSGQAGQQQLLGQHIGDRARTLAQLDRTLPHLPGLLDLAVLAQVIAKVAEGLGLGQVVIGRLQRRREQRPGRREQRPGRREQRPGRGEKAQA
jgi:hypothetical protein